MIAVAQTIQTTLERKSLDRGASRYLKSLKRDDEDGNVFAVVPYTNLMTSCLPRVTEALRSYVTDADNHGRGRTPFAVSVLKTLDLNLVSLAGLAKAFEGVCRRLSVPTVTRAIARHLELEAVVIELDQRDRKVGRGRKAKASKSAQLADQLKERHSNPRRREDTALKILKDNLGWTDAQASLLGNAVLNAVLIGAKDVFERYAEGGARSKVELLGLTPEAQAFVTQSHDLAQWMRPAHVPMVVPPRPWRSMRTGAYLTKEVARTVPLVRTFDPEARKAVEDAIADGSMAPCIEAVNAIQAVRLRIDGQSLDLVRWAFDSGIALDGFPRRDPLPLLRRPSNWDTLDERAQSLWRRRAQEVHARNRGIASDVAAFRVDLETAETLRGQTFFLPHNLDFRGRVYPVPHFSHHRADHIRSLIQFSEGKPLGEDGAWWLAVHLANCGDFEKVSKKPFEARVQWVLDNSDEIVRVALDPEGTVDFWSGADCPFSFVAACREWAGYMDEGEAFVSHLPIGLDGSNSGLQHYSAILRDEEGGKLVNLVPAEAPADVYAAVAAEARRLVELETFAGLDLDRVELGLLWLAHGITRSVVKRNVMTFAYSSETYGFAQQLVEDLMKPLRRRQEDEGIPHPFGDVGTQARAAQYLAEYVWQAVNTVVRRAGEGMRWFQEIARLLAHQGRGVRWTTPVGLPVVHMYREYETATVTLYLYDKETPVLDAAPGDKVEGDKVFNLVQATIRTKPLKRVRKSKQKSAVAPNVIHSLDAAHLMKVVLRAKDEGITDVLLIHDSFATHAAEAGRWSQIIRDEFASMYEAFDPFAEIAGKAFEYLNEIPPVPGRGSLDLNQTRDALYAFA